MTIAPPNGIDHPTTLSPASTGRLVSGEAVELEIRLARVGSRVLALLLDIGVQLVLLYTLITVISMLTIAASAHSGAPSDALMNAMIVVILVGIFVGYPVTLETFTAGRTVGKLALGLRVVRDDGGPIRFRHALTRSLVGVALEWPGFILPLVTWIASLTTMLANPAGKRLGDLAAGTVVIHDRTPASWGWVPSMPPQLAGWARTLDLTALPNDLALAVRHFLARNRRIAEPFRSRLGYSLASEVAARTTPAPPVGVPGWMYLAAVVAERHRRSARQLALARGIAAQIWPELASPKPPSGTSPRTP
ncbi:MAG: RDD family protein [Dactylosporangium sp.]|nr:RDD family protein [Dactylosporangium sp.]NNJ60242.1 RDD family protein [Dactylosporangium sp.]